MNIFVVDENPIKSANQLCDKHVVKMVTESAQMLSTAHRLLDGEMYIEKTANGRNIKRWRLPDGREDILMKACHTGHPCTIWTMASDENYKWHVQHYMGLVYEYNHRYNKSHGAWINKDIGSYLLKPPNNISKGPRTPFAIAMKHYPECIVEGDAVQSYRNYYNVAKSSFAKWTNRNIPDWYTANL